MLPYGKLPKMIRKNLIVLVALLSSISFGAPKKLGVFSHPRCIVSLKRIYEDNGKVFAAEARAEGHTTEAEIKEYVERRIRQSYLEKVAVDAIDEMALADHFFSILTDKGYFKDVKVKDRQKSIISGVTRANHDTNSILFQILKTHPPKNLTEMEELKGILAQKAILEGTRAAISEGFLTLPMTGRIDQLDATEVRDLGHQVTHLVLAQAARLPHIKEVFEEADLLGQFPGGSAAIKAQNNEIAAGLEKHLLAVKGVPEAVKQSIRDEMDFNRKYGLERNLVYIYYLNSLNVYFEHLQ